MVLACGDRVKFYESQDLKCWKYLSKFGMNKGPLEGVFECPNLFPLKLEGDNTKWILKVDIIKGAIAGVSEGRYYIGHFDGINFESDNSSEIGLLIDFGKDFYAVQTFFDDKGRRIASGWMEMWELDVSTKEDTLEVGIELFADEGSGY